MHRSQEHRPSVSHGRPETGTTLPSCRPVIPSQAASCEGGFSWVLPQTPAAAGQARRLTRHLLLRWDLAEHCDTAELLVSELVSNAITHGNGPVTLHVGRRHGALRCEVTDRCADGPWIRPLSMDGETGRGMHLLEMLAERWGVRLIECGKRVWFELVA